MPLPIPEARDSGYTGTLPVPLYWCAYGPEGGERLLVLHGGPGASHDYLLPQMLGLADPFELIFYDQRGGGRSRTQDQSPITWRTHVEDLSGFIREHSLDPLSIVGYSWGALLAMLYMIEAFAGDSHFPPVRLALLDPAPVTHQFRLEFEREFARRQASDPVRSMREALQKSGLEQSDRDGYRQRAFELSVAGYFADPARASELTPFRVVGRIQRTVWESLGDFDVVAGLAGVRCHALVVHGRDDPIPLASSQQAASALAAELVILEDCGHVPYVEQSEKLFTAVRRFLAATESNA